MFQISCDQFHDTGNLVYREAIASSFETGDFSKSVGV
jgi:hypothetical protein